MTIRNKKTVTNTSYKKVGGSVLFDSSLLSITLCTGGQERKGKCPPSYMPKTLAVIVRDNKRKKKNFMKLNPIIIETNRLFLKGYSPKDMTNIFRNYSKNEIIEILGHRTEEEYLNEKSKEENGYAAYNRSFILFLLTEKTSNLIIGRCGFHNWNIEHKRAEIGYNIVDEMFKCKGFMTEAVNAVIEYGFKELKLHRIEALVGSNNIASLKIIKKHRFIKEGLLRQHYFIADKYEDSILFSKLYDEYIMDKGEKITNRSQFV